MGVVYLAEDTALGRQVALKVLSPECVCDDDRLARFREEARAVAALNHPNIVTLYSVEEEDGSPFLTMELVEGEGLDRLIPQSGVSLERFYELAIPLADAVAVAHDKGVIHRDLKPGNVMVTDDGRLKVLDFGLAKVRPTATSGESKEETTAALTVGGKLLGTVPYMAPEQIEGRSVDHRADIFSLGALLYEMATGQTPFRGSSTAGVISAILRDHPTPVVELRPGWPPLISRLIRRCLEKDPDRRLQSVRDLANELSDLQSDTEPVREPPRSIAVVPFADMSPERDHDYFCEGIAEEILNALARIETLRVAARSSAFQFKDRSADVQEIGRRLNVSAVLEGSVRKAGDRVRITVQLVNVADGYQLWSERFDRQIQDIFVIQDEIAQSVVDALRVTLSADEERAIKGEWCAADIEAYDYYLRGLQYVDETSQRGFEFALEMFRKAVEIDPVFVRAYAGIANCHAWLFHWFGREETDLAEAERASRRAVELGPDLAEAHTARGFVLSLVDRLPEAVSEFETAIRLDPKHFDAYYYYGRIRFANGEFAEAAELFETAAAVSPEEYQAISLLPQVYRSLGRERDEEEAFRRAFERIERRLELNPDDARALYLGAGAHLVFGDRERAIRWTDRATSLRPDDVTTLYNCACLYSKAGESDRAFECLEHAFATGAGFKSWIEHDSDLDPLRSDTRFGELLTRLG